MILFVLLIFLGLTYITNKKPVIVEKNYKQIPKTIWTYWHTGYLPNLIHSCIKTWKNHNKDYTIVVLTKTNLKNYLPDVNIYRYKHATSQQKIADFIRLEILERYGGFWVDASIIMTESLDVIRDKGDFVGYYLEDYTTDSMYPVIENWFFGCVTENLLVKKWNKEFKRMNQFKTTGDYINDLKKNTNFQNINVNLLDYLTCHLALQKVIQNTKIEGNIKLFKAEDGPYKYLHKNNWDSKLGIEALNNKWNENKHSIIKLRGTERQLINSGKINIKNI